MPVAVRVQPVRIPVGAVVVDGDLRVPSMAAGLVIAAHGDGSSRRASRNRHMAEYLESHGFATLLLDLLTGDEELADRRTRELRFDIARLAERVTAAIDWVACDPVAGPLPLGCLGAGTGAAAVLVAAADRPDRVKALISRGGRPDLAAGALARVVAPTLLVVGGLDEPVIGFNRRAQAQMHAPVRLEIVPGARQLFDEPGTLEDVCRLATAWCWQHLLTRARPA